MTGTTHHIATAPGGLHAPVLTLHSSKVVDLARILNALRSDEHYASLVLASGAAVYADLRPVVVKAEVAAWVGLAFCKLFRNALTHAFPCGSTGHIGVHLWPVTTLSGMRAFLLIADDGQGFGDEPPATSDSGIPVAQHCVERCGGTLTRIPASGTVWRIALPLGTEMALNEQPVGST